MSKFKLHLSLGLLVCLVAEPVLAQTTRRGGSDSGSSSSGSSSSRGSSSSSSGSSSSSSGSHSRASEPSRSSSSSSSSGSYSRPEPTRERSRPEAQPTRAPRSEPSRERSQSQAQPSRERDQPQAQPTRAPRQSSDNSSSTRRETRRDNRQQADNSRTSRQQAAANNGRVADPSASRRVQDRAVNRQGAASVTVRRDYNPSQTVHHGVAQTVRNNYGTRNFHNPYGYDHNRPFRDADCYHHPHVNVYHHTVILTPYVYYNHIYTNASACYYYDWLFCHTSRVNGYYIIDNYPFYVYNGNYHRYSNIDNCNYQLIDTYTRRVKHSYWEFTCNRAFDECSDARDYLNRREFAIRYECAETYRGRNYQYFNTYNENDYAPGGYNTSTADDFYENDYIAPEYSSASNLPASATQVDAAVMTPINPVAQATEEEIAPGLSSLAEEPSDDGAMAQREMESDTQDY